LLLIIWSQSGRISIFSDFIFNHILFNLIYFETFEWFCSKLYLNQCQLSHIFLP
jgi:hypothetical protein